MWGNLFYDTRQNKPLNRLQPRLGAFDETHRTGSLLDPTVAVVAQWPLRHLGFKRALVREPGEFAHGQIQNRCELANCLDWLNPPGGGRAGSRMHFARPLSRTVHPKAVPGAETFEPLVLTNKAHDVTKTRTILSGKMFDHT